ncbi:hypothetical protein [Marinoscillum furvescens]|uniref:YcxB-like protein n=1 Tax=Marinoscillum furvescens DSM 4134 TaxID=1122208 RepID=A0A3D9LIW1_MARFU|nr:hypothetical protein [Marinoscillum furvescens]REE05805.1 hypothetical protein C7460_101324 [Marinoscillum furvescens DSM 4134]
MNIKTNQFSLSKNKLLQLLLMRYAKRRWGLLLTIFILGIYISTKEYHDKIDYYFLILFGLYPFLIVFQYMRWVNSKDNSLFLLPRLYEINETKITGYIDGGNESTINRNLITKSYSLRSAYFLHISKEQFLYFPFECFQSETDRKWFVDTYIKEK